MWRVHRLDQIYGKKPANLAVSKSLTLKESRHEGEDSVRFLDPASELAPRGSCPALRNRVRYRGTLHSPTQRVLVPETGLRWVFPARGRHFQSVVVADYRD